MTSAKPNGPAWVPCPDCGGFYCTIHQAHTDECPCPPIDDWTTDPYMTYQKNPHANPHASALGSIRTAKKAKSSAENGKKGGRPKKAEPTTAAEDPYDLGSGEKGYPALAKALRRHGY